MNSKHPTGGSAVSLEQLQALNDEMAALVRAGVPLEQGLVQAARSLPGQAGTLAQQFAQRLSAGESLEEILAADDTRLPAVWRTVVRAGIRSGDLAAALQGLSETARRAVDLRHSVIISLVYPLLLVCLAYLLLLLTTLRLAPTMLFAFEDLTGSTNRFLGQLTWLGRHAVWWAPWLPVAVGLVLVVAWYRSGRAVSSLADSMGPLRWGHRARGPGIRQTVLAGRIATFIELLALLLRHRVPTAEAITLAGDASGDARLRTTTQALAESIRRGAVIRRREDLPAGFPPLLAWSLVSGATSLPVLERVLATSAQIYRRQAERGVQWTAIYLPILLTATLGGATVLVLGLITFVPFVQLLYQLQLPT